jgi:histidine triad (HIT) family protein
VRFAPLNPVTPGHLLFVPKRHITGPQDDPWLAGVVCQTAALHARTASQDHDVTAWNVIINDGPAASQTVFHLHVHLVPRTPDDGLKLPWTGQVKA